MWSYLNTLLFPTNDVCTPFSKKHNNVCRLFIKNKEFQLFLFMCIQLQIYLSPPKGAKKSSSCAPARHTCVRGCWRWRRASVNTVASTPMTCSWRSVTPRPPSARTCWRTLGSPSCHSNRSETGVLMISLETRYKNIFFVLKWWSLNTQLYLDLFLIRSNEKL